MMNNGNSILFSQGLQISNANGNIDKTSYKAVYSGKKGKMLIKNKGKSYYIEANENDMANLFNQPTSNDKLSEKLTKLMKKTTKKIRIKKSSKKKKKRYTVKKSKTRSKTRPKTKSKTPKKKRSVKNKVQNLISDDLLKTIN